MIKEITFVLVILCVTTLPVLGDVSQDDIYKSINKDNLRHPYLYFTEEEKPAILERIENDPECNDIMLQLLAEGNRLLYTPVETEVPDQGKNPRFTGQNPLLDYLQSNRSAAIHLAFLYQMTGDESYAHKAFEFSEVVCDLPTWVDRRHQFPIIYSRVWPWNVSDDQVNFSVDLDTADTARTLAAVYDWLYPVLTKRQRDRIRGAILEKAITRVRGNYEYHWWASSYRCNWCACINANLGVASIALLTEEPHLTDVIAESFNRITKQFDEIGINGGWQEGCGYYRKSIDAVNHFADPLKRLTKGTYNLYNHPRLRDNPITFLLYNSITPGRLIPFEDSAYWRAGTSHIWNKLAEETQSMETAWFRDYMFGSGRNIFDIIWPRSSIEPGLPKQTSIFFHSIDWVVMRSGFTDPEEAVLACKAGMNDDPHHGHLDCGHFAIYWRDQGYICDIGSSIYDELYFDEIRWEYPQASSIGHNVLFVNGELQIPAKRKNTPWKDGIGGKILEFRPGKNRDYTLMDPTGAYPGKELKGWRRHIILEKPVITVVLDEVKAQLNAEIETRFHSEATQHIRNGYLLLDGDKGKMALIPLVDGNYILRPGKHDVLPVQEKVPFKWIPYCGTVVIARDTTTVIATIILPVEDDTEAKEIFKSAKRSEDSLGNITVSFAKSGRTYSYRYEKEPEGLVLR